MWHCYVGTDKPVAVQTHETLVSEMPWWKKQRYKDTTVLQEPVVGTYDTYCILNVATCTWRGTESYI